MASLSAQPVDRQFVQIRMSATQRIERYAPTVPVAIAALEFVRKKPKCVRPAFCLDVECGHLLAVYEDGESHGRVPVIAP